MPICRPLHGSAQPALFSGPTPSFPSLESEAGTSRWGDIPSWEGTFGPRTTRPGGQLVLGPHVRGDSWSGGTRGPPTTVLINIGLAIPDTFFRFFISISECLPENLSLNYELKGSCPV